MIFFSYFQCFFLIFKDFLLNGALFCIVPAINYLFQFINPFFQNMLFASFKTSILVDKNDCFLFIVIYMHTHAYTNVLENLNFLYHFMP